MKYRIGDILQRCDIEYHLPAKVIITNIKYGCYIFGESDMAHNIETIDKAYWIRKVGTKLKYVLKNL